MATVDDIARMIRPLKSRLFNLMARGVVSLVNGQTLRQTLQVKVLDDEALDDVQHYQPYGYTSRPFAGTETIVLFINGDRAQAIALVVDDMASRPTDFEEGESGLFTDEDNQDDPEDRFLFKMARGRILFGRADKLDVKCNTEAKIDAPSVLLAGGDKSAAMAEPIATFLSDMLSYVAGLQAPPGGGPVTPTVPAPTLPTIASSKVKVGS